jgi:hypothetical protein
MDIQENVKRRYKKFAESEAVAKLKDGWDENPYAVIAVATGAIYATSKLIGAVAASRNSRAWKKEVNRRVKKFQ